MKTFMRAVRNLFRIFATIMLIGVVLGVGLWLGQSYSAGPVVLGVIVACIFIIRKAHRGWETPIDVSDHRKTYFFGLSPTGHRSRQPRLWRGIGGNGSVQRLNRPQIEHRQRVGERRGAGELIVPPP